MGNKQSNPTENVFLKNPDELDDRDKLFIQANTMAPNSFPNPSEFIRAAGKDQKNTEELVSQYEEARAMARMDPISAINADIYLSANTLQTTHACWVSLAYKMKIPSSIILQFTTALDSGRINSRGVSRFIKMVQKAEHKHYKRMEKSFITKTAENSIGLINNLYRGASSRIGKGSIFMGGYMMSGYSTPLAATMMAYGPLATLCVIPDALASRKSVMLGVCLVIGALYIGFSGLYSYILRNTPGWTLKVLNTAGVTHIKSPEEAMEWATNWLTNGLHDMALNNIVAKGMAKEYNNTIKPYIQENVLDTKFVKGVTKIHNAITIPTAVFIQKAVEVMAENSDTIKKGIGLGSKALDFIQSDTGMKTIDILDVFGKILEERADTVELLMDGAQNIALLVDANADTISNAAAIAGGLKKAAVTMGIISSNTKGAQKRLSIASSKRLEDLKKIHAMQSKVFKQRGVKNDADVQELLDRMADQQGPAGVGLAIGGGGGGGGGGKIGY
jgi:hypothetical protein